MSVQWNKYHVGFNVRGNKLFIGRGELKQDGIMKYSDKSDNRTVEIIHAVMSKMRYDLGKREDDRPYVGYDLPGFGKLVFVKSGYDIHVEKSKEVPKGRKNT